MIYNNVLSGKHNLIIYREKIYNDACTCNEYYQCYKYSDDFISVVNILYKIT